MSSIIFGGMALAAYFSISRMNCTADSETHRSAHQAPSTWLEALYLFAEALRYTFRETFAKWRTGDLLLGLAYLARKQLATASTAEDFLKGSLLDWSLIPVDERAAKLSALEQLHRDMVICMVTRFRKPAGRIKQLESLGIPEDAVLFSQDRSDLLKPLCMVIKDERRKALMLVVRGTTSFKDVFTVLTAAPKPHHVVGVDGVVLGYSHFGMLAAARWICKLVKPLLEDFLKEHEEWQLRLVGHSLGGGTAALLCMMLREDTESLSSRATCASIACPAVMTHNLAKSCAPYVTSIVNGLDLVPTFNTISMEHLRHEVLESCWLDHFRRDMRSSSFLYRAAETSIRAVGLGTYWTAAGLYAVTKATGSLFIGCMPARRKNSHDGQVPDVPENDTGLPLPGLGHSVPKLRGQSTNMSTSKHSKLLWASEQSPLANLIVAPGAEGAAEADERAAGCACKRRSVDGAAPTFDVWGGAFTPSSRSGGASSAVPLHAHRASPLMEEDLERLNMLEALLDEEADTAARFGLPVSQAAAGSKVYASMHAAAVDFLHQDESFGSAAALSMEAPMLQGMRQAGMGPVEGSAGTAADEDDESVESEGSQGAHDFEVGLSQCLDAYNKACETEAQSTTSATPQVQFGPAWAHHRDSQDGHSCSQASAGGPSHRKGYSQGSMEAGRYSDAGDCVAGPARMLPAGDPDGTDATVLDDFDTTAERERLYPAGRILHMLPYEMLLESRRRREKPMLWPPAMAHIDHAYEQDGPDHRAGPSQGQDEHRPPEEQPLEPCVACATPQCADVHAQCEGNFGREGAAETDAVQGDCSLGVCSESEVAPACVLVEDVPQNAYGRIILCRNMLFDHYLSQYLASLDEIIQSGSRSELSISNV